MNFDGLINFFITPERSSVDSRKAKLLIRASLLSSLFSGVYVVVGLAFDFYIGAQLMAVNIFCNLFLPFLLRTKLSIVTLGNFYVMIGGVAIILLAILSGGIQSAIYPWIISIPIMALLIVNRKSAIIWGLLSFLTMVLMGLATVMGFQFPNELNTSNEALWILFVLPGLLLITFLITYIFQSTLTNALDKLAKQNDILVNQKNTIAAQKEELTSLIDDKNYIIRIMAHDIRSPLKNIQGLIELLSEEKDGARKEKITKLLLRSSVSAENLVNRVLEMDKSEDENVKAAVVKIDIIKLLKDLVENVQEHANQKLINIELKDEATKHKINADSSYIHLIFENLLSNAIKFSEEGKNIEVKITNSNTHIQIAVIDEGPGINIEEEELLFKKFSKLSARPTAGESSTGLGLSLVKRYVELSNGKVWHEQNLANKGATFIVEFPLAS
ncbi:HAMP domain-containing sensor histidine kinase [Marivirga sp.]|uniref:sensor histidine kinase n=1 Tax=Marivirga sp. TaxID=2018662 RepID=UPI002D8039CE|nr:HAMP domain-containing sensor histidine kinase [Marivirga sp.]HET8859614.1 HAMP domain-containing sensor histidine kinase [Marivirga sp.]